VRGGFGWHLLGSALRSLRRFVTIVMRFIVYLASVGLVLSALAAQPAFAESRTDRETHARELFAAGSYREALDIYTKLYAETTHPTYIRNIGRCYQNLGDADKAIASFREYLRQAGDLTPPQRAQIEAYIAEMTALKRGAQETRRSPPEGSASVGPGSTSAASPSEGPAPRPAVETVATAPADNAHPPESAGQLQGERDPGARAPSRAPAYVVGAASVLAIGVGAVFGVRAISERHDSDKNCPMGLCTQAGVSLNDQAKSSARVADIAIGGGLVGAAIAAYLFFSVGSVDGKSDRGAAAALRLLPEIDRSQAGLALGGSW
jgi:tetratricopeptide (TPR) repeat protein